MIDVVYPLGDGSAWGNNELRFSLRSLQKNLRDLGRVFVVGRRPPWLIEAIHIPMEDVHRHNKDANLIDKVLAACRAGVSERFLRLSDDQCLLRPVSARELKAFHLGRLDDKRAGFWGSGKWKRRLRRTLGLLLHEGLPTLHYDSHIPMVYQRERFLEIMTRRPYREGLGYCINTLYFNHVPMKIRHALQGRKLTVERPLGSVEQIRERLQGKTYLGYNNAGLTPELKQVLAELFPVPSHFEGDAADQRPADLPECEPEEACATTDA